MTRGVFAILKESTLNKMVAEIYSLGCQAIKAATIRKT